MLPPLPLPHPYIVSLATPLCTRRGGAGQDERQASRTSTATQSTIGVATQLSAELTPDDHCGGSELGARHHRPAPRATPHARGSYL